MTLVSVVIPTYNSAKYLPETLDSILSQSYRNIEIIIVDDASTDNTKEVVQSINSDKIRYILLDENHGGPSKPRNVGVSAAKGKYISLFDADDIMLPGVTESAVSFLDSYSHLGFVFTDAIKFEDNDRLYPNPRLYSYDIFRNIKKKRVGDTWYIIDSENAYHCLFFENFVMPSGVTAPKTVFEEIGGFDKKLTNADDWDMWFRISNKFPIGFIDSIGFRYRVGHSGISSKGSILAENRTKVIRKQLKEDLPNHVRKRAHYLISQNFIVIGYHYQIREQLKYARSYYFRSLKEFVGWLALKGILLSFLGVRTLNVLRKMKILVQEKFLR